MLNPMVIKYFFQLTSLTQNSTSLASIFAFQQQCESEDMIYQVFGYILNPIIFLANFLNTKFNLFDISFCLLTRFEPVNCVIFQTTIYLGVLQIYGCGHTFARATFLVLYFEKKGRYHIQKPFGKNIVAPQTSHWKKICLVIFFKSSLIDIKD